MDRIVAGPPIYENMKHKLVEDSEIISCWRIVLKVLLQSCLVSCADGLPGLKSRSVYPAGWMNLRLVGIGGFQEQNND